MSLWDLFRKTAEKQQGSTNSQAQNGNPVEIYRHTEPMEEKLISLKCLSVAALNQRLVQASVDGDLQMVKDTVSAGADIESISLCYYPPNTNRPFSECRVSYKGTALRAAIIGKQVGIIEFLKSAGARGSELLGDDQKTLNGKFVQAAFNGNLQALKDSFSAGAHTHSSAIYYSYPFPRKPNDCMLAFYYENGTPLSAAIKGSHKDVIDFLENLKS